MSFKEKFGQVVGDHVLDVRSLLAVVWSILRDGRWDVNEVKTVVLGYYDEHIAPRDIPGIPNIVEPVFDRIVRSMIETGIEQLAAETV